jgi:hypothetical protein
MNADFKDMVIYSLPDGYDINSAQREYVTGQIKISFFLNHSQQWVIKKNQWRGYLRRKGM